MDTIKPHIELFINKMNPDLLDLFHIYLYIYKVYEKNEVKLLSCGDRTSGGFVLSLFSVNVRPHLALIWFPFLYYGICRSENINAHPKAYP